MPFTEEQKKELNTATGAFRDLTEKEVLQIAEIIHYEENGHPGDFEKTKERTREYCREAQRFHTFPADLYFTVKRLTMK